jgi:outer membrane protein assembly factor BamB/tetratricopeptide (TPR) repeat protein
MPLSQRTFAAALVLAAVLSASRGTEEPPAPRPLPLPVDREIAELFDSLQIRIERRDWKQAAAVLARVLDPAVANEFVVPRGGAEGRRIPARSEAYRILAALPAPGLDAYRALQAPAAAALLKEAKEKDDSERLARLVRLYPFTPACAEGLQVMGEWHRFNGRQAEAARCYELLADQLPVEKWPIEALYSAVIACHRTKLSAQAAPLEKELLGRLGQDGAMVGDRKVTAESLKKDLVPPPAGPQPRNWPQFGGTPSRTAEQPGNAPHVLPLYEIELTRTDDSRAWVKQAAEMLAKAGEPRIAAGVPLVLSGDDVGDTGPYVVFHSQWGTHAHFLKTGAQRWEASSAWSLDRMARDVKKVEAVKQWMTFYLLNNTRPSVIFENSIVGQLSAGSRYVYVVEDLAVPPPPGVHWNPRRRPGVPDVFNENVSEAIQASRLQAYDPLTGKIKWEVGGGWQKHELEGSCFLGPPLVLNKRLYVLTEKKQRLRLAVLEPATGQVLSVRDLCGMPEPISMDPLRRCQALMPAFDRGILVCPTGTGALIGIDVLQHAVAWAHVCGERAQPVVVEDDRPRLNPKANLGTPFCGPAVPYLTDGKVVYLCAESRVLVCLDLHTGVPAWQKRLAADDLYLAGVSQGKVLLVGKRNCRGLKLATGETLWTAATGLPSGLGQVASGTLYLPLEEGIETRAPEICALDVDCGQVRSHLRCRRPVGNLVFAEGFIVSQSATTLAAFPEAQAVGQRIEERLKKNPADPEGLADRARMRLTAGQLKPAVDDLSAALAGKPDAALKERVRGLLYDALLDLIERDPEAGAPYLKEHEALLRDGPVPAAASAEERQQQARFHALAAQVYASQGPLPAAFDNAMRLASPPLASVLVAVPGDPDRRIAARLWGRALVTRLQGDAQFRAVIARRWQAVQEKPDAAELRAFVRLVGTATEEGRAAHLLLADLCRKEKAYREADLLLQAVRRSTDDPIRAARALAMLVELALDQALIPDAIHYARVLKEEYLNVPLGDGRTGADVYDGMVTDKRLLPFLEAPAVPAGELQATLVRRQNGVGEGACALGQEGELLPFFARHELALLPDAGRLWLRDRDKDGASWSVEGPAVKLRISSDLNRARWSPLHLRPLFTSLHLGHLTVVNRGDRVVGLDPVARRVLWQRALYPQETVQAVLASGQGSLEFASRGKVDVPLGRVLLSPEVVVVQAGDGLTGLDPLTGETLWQRPKLGPGCCIFGDGQHLAVVETEEERVTATHLLRMADGSAVPARDFAALYDSRFREVGCNLLIASSRPGGSIRLRVYDVRAGKDSWQRDLPAGSALLDSTDPGLVGWVEPEGKLRVLRTEDAVSLLNAEIERGIAERMTGGWVVPTGDQFLVLANGAIDRQRIRIGPTPSLPALGGWPALPVNGTLFAFDRDGGKLTWQRPVALQNLLLYRLDESPVLLFTTGYVETPPPMKEERPVKGVLVLRKSDGKVLLESLDLPGLNEFHELRIDRAASRVTLTGTEATVTIAPEAKKE